MKFTSTEIPGLMMIEPRVFGDDRGYFYESYHRDKFQENGIDYIFEQDNISKSSRGVLRGLHFQEPPYEQGKLIKVFSGAVLDVAVDIRKNSPTYGKHCSVRITAENKLMFWIPPGFAHGFVALEDNTVFSYKCTNVYNKESENSIRWDDTDLNIDWGISDPILSEKDANAPLFSELDSKFNF